MGLVRPWWRDRRVVDQPIYRYKSARCTHRGRTQVIDRWESDGWEFLFGTERGRRLELTFRRRKSARGFRYWTARAGLAVCLVVALLISFAQMPHFKDPLSEIRARADAAVEALQVGDLRNVGFHLAANRGQTDFAYFFTARATPRALGDALASVAGDRSEETFKAGVSASEYELALADLAGTVALATHGVRDRALPVYWARDFLQATTVPIEVDGSTTQRTGQDVANRQNLLLLLSRGYWSRGFLQDTTRAYWEYDRKRGADAWPRTRLEGAKYAPAPNGTYLTDGILALTAALTANPAASKWAFADFLPGTQVIEGSDRVVSRFTHFLLFEHRFPDGSDGETLGMTATLTALSSAIDGGGGDVEAQAVASERNTQETGPLSDARVLRELAGDLADDRGCSWNPRDYWKCAKSVAASVLDWIQHWGHLVLDILSLATLAPMPIRAVGIAAAATNATWYAIEGDFAKAGLSLTLLVPMLAFAKVAWRTKGPAKVLAPRASDKVARAAMAWRAKTSWKSCERVAGGMVLKYQDGWTRAQRRAADAKVKAISAAAERGDLRKTVVERSGTSRSKFQAAGGKLPAGSDVDHIVDLQLGGSDDLSNLQALDQSVNRSFGKQLEAGLKTFAVGAPILAVSICR